MADAPNRDDARALHEAQINNALGTFLAIFGLLVLVSIFFTDTGIGKLANLGAGVIISGIGALMIYRARRLRRSQ
ncbi:MAG: hypothetical protein JW955_23580 [Sedimentisphaerales bacterium]|nr:hypothetical protein [Sedimentisphaerales bacterium]